MIKSVLFNVISITMLLPLSYCYSGILPNIGSTKYENEHVPNITAIGSLKIINCIVDESISVCGSLRAVDSQMGSLSVSGGCSLQESIVTDKVYTMGGMKSTNCDLNDITVSGGCSVIHTRISGEVEIIGGFLSEESRIDKMITVTAKKVLLNNSQVGSINLYPESSTESELLELNNTIVYGDVLFASGKGKVLLSGKSKIKGKVKGGVVQ